MPKQKSCKLCTRLQLDWQAKGFRYTLYPLVYPDSDSKPLCAIVPRPPISRQAKWRLLDGGIKCVSQEAATLSGVPQFTVCLLSIVPTACAMLQATSSSDNCAHIPVRLSACPLLVHLPGNLPVLTDGCRREFWRYKSA